MLQDFTGVAALVDLAAMRDAVVKAGGDPKQIDAKCPADLVIDHCVSVDFLFSMSPARAILLPFALSFYNILLEGPSSRELLFFIFW